MPSVGNLFIEIGLKQTPKSIAQSLSGIRNSIKTTIDKFNDLGTAINDIEAAAEKMTDQLGLQAVAAESMNQSLIATLDAFTTLAEQSIELSKIIDQNLTATIKEGTKSVSDLVDELSDLDKSLKDYEGREIKIIPSLDVGDILEEMLAFRENLIRLGGFFFPITPELDMDAIKNDISNTPVPIKLDVPDQIPITLVATPPIDLSNFKTTPPEIKVKLNATQQKGFGKRQVNVDFNVKNIDYTNIGGLPLIIPAEVVATVNINDVMNVLSGAIGQVNLPIHHLYFPLSRRSVLREVMNDLHSWDIGMPIHHLYFPNEQPKDYLQELLDNANLTMIISDIWIPQDVKNRVAPVVLPVTLSDVSINNAIIMAQQEASRFQFRLPISGLDLSNLPPAELNIVDGTFRAVSIIEDFPHTVEVEVDLKMPEVPESFKADLEVLRFTGHLFDYTGATKIPTWLQVAGFRSNLSWMTGTGFGRPEMTVETILNVKEIIGAALGLEAGAIPPTMTYTPPTAPITPTGTPTPPSPPSQSGTPSSGVTFNIDIQVNADTITSDEIVDHIVQQVRERVTTIMSAFLGTGGTL